MRARMTEEEVDETAEDCGSASAAVELCTLGHDWSSPGLVDASSFTANTWALPHFVDQAEWLRRRQRQAADDIACLRTKFENGEWELQRLKDGVAAHSSNDGNHRMRDALARQVEHTRRLQRMIGGAMPTEQEEQVIDNLIDPPKLTPAQARALQANADRQAERERLGQLGIVPNIHNRLKASMAATYLNVSERTLERWRAQGIGPSFIRIGGRYEYAMSAIADYIDSQTDLAG